jgi:hypothetical protein
MTRRRKDWPVSFNMIDTVIATQDEVALRFEQDYGLDAATALDLAVRATAQDAAWLMELENV